MTLIALGFWAIIAQTILAELIDHDYSQYVNPLVGGSGPIPGLAFGGGDIFVGGALPFGVAKVGIDTYETNVSLSTINGGWTPQGLVTGISMLHESGTGGDPKYGIITQMPLTSVAPPINVLDNTTYWQPRVGNDTAQVGYFRTQLASGVTVELSAARHTGLMQYTFPSGTSEKHVLVDVSHYLPDEGGSPASQVFLGGHIEINANSTSSNGSSAASSWHYSGFGTYGGGWNEGAPLTVFFCGDFDTPPDEARTFRGRNTDPMQRYHGFDGPLPQATFGRSGAESSGPLNDRIGAVFSWTGSSNTQIRSRVGISFISTEKACACKDAELPSFDLNATVAAAVEEWNRDVFSKIRVPTDASANRTNLALLYSSLYFTHLMPSDRTGENPLWASAEPYWDDFYTLWDIFRCTVSLYHLLQPARYAGMVRALIDIWRHEGFMPDGRSGNSNGLVQGGSNADNVLADAYVKGLQSGINWTDGYAAMKTNAERVPFNTYSALDRSASVKEGRGALADWLAVGYVAAESTRCVSRTVEYALNDYALSVVAAGEGSPGDAQKYLARSAGWQRLWNPNVTSHSFTGFLTPRNLNGSWAADGYVPGLCGGCEWTSVSYEGTPWEYSFTVPMDMQTLIERMGGSDEFERRLDYIFQPNTSEQDLEANGAGITTIMNIGNEPDFATPYLYNYLNKQWKSVNQSRALTNQFFHDALYGVPGNSDAGALNSWLIWQMLGLYPVVTQPVYLLQSPWFADINMSVSDNATLRITSKSGSSSSGGGGGQAGLGQSGYYVQGVKINGKEWTKNWFEHEDVMVSGGTVEFTVGEEPRLWEMGDVPPSPGHYDLGETA